MNDERETSGQSRAGCLTVLRYVFFMIAGGVLFLALVAGIGVWQAGDRFAEGLDTIFNAPTPTPTIDIRSVVVKQIRDASELTTSVFAMETIAEASQSREILGVEVGETRLLYIGYGEVRAGIDLREIEVDDIEVTENAIRIRIPPPRVLDSKIDVNRSRVYDYDQGFLSLGPDAPALQSLAEQDALAKIVLSACENGILDDANQKAEVAIAQLLNVTGFNEVEVETQTPAGGTCSAR